MDRFEKYLDKLVNKVITETVDSKADKIVSEIEKKSGLKGKQHKIDVADPKGKITAADFKKLRATKKDMKEYSMGDDQIEKVEPYGDFSTDSPKKVGKVKNVGYDYEKKVAKEFNEEETEEGNAFSGALAQAKKLGKKSFEVDGKTYEVTEMEGFHGDFEDEDTKLARFVKDALKRNSMLFSKADKELSKKDKDMKRDLEDMEDEEYGRHMWIGEEKDGKFIQKATKKMEKKGTEGKFGAWCKSHGLDKDGEVTKKCIDKAMKSDDSKVVKMANFAKNIGGFKGAKHESVQMTESEIVELIERLVNEEKANIEKKRPTTDKEMNKISNANKNTNQEALKATTEKMKKWSQDSNVEGYTTEPKHFPKGNGEMKEMDKKAYKASDAVEEYIDAFAYPGMTNLVYDEIKPNDEWIEANLKGSSKTGNATKDKDGNDLGNVVSSELGEKMFKNYKDNVYGAEQMNASYKRYPQPVDQAGESTEDGDLKLKKGAAKSEKIFKQLESTSEKDNVLNEQLSRMKNIVGYNQKTQ